MYESMSYSHQHVLAFVNIEDTALHDPLESYPYSRGAFHNAAFVLVCFSVTNLESYENSKNMIRKIHSEYVNSVIIAVGTMIDLVEERKISTEVAKNYFSTMDPPISYFETSALTGEGVNELFESALRLWRESPEPVPFNDNQSEVRKQDRKTDYCIIC